MPYLAFDLDALENCPNIAQGCGLRTEQVTHGLLMMWRHCWREKVDHITTAHLKAFFSGADACEMLLTFGHIAADSEGWRVRGAEKYLRVSAAQSAAGKAKSGNLQRGRQDLKQPQTSGSPPAPPPALLRPLPANSEQLTASSEQKASAAKKPAADPRLKPLTETLAVAFQAIRGEKYRHSGAKDATALKSLLPVATDEAIADRWATGLRGSGWSSCSTFAQLASKWNDLAAPKAANKGPVDAATQKHTQTGVITDSGVLTLEELGWSPQ